MIIHAGHNLHYPIRVRKLLKSKGDEVERSTALFEYEYTTMVAEGREMKEVAKKYIATFQSEGEGTILKWLIKENETIERPGPELVHIDEPCTHETQYNGMCVACGKDMDEINYMTTTKDTARATITMVHGSSELKVSQGEANRSSESAMRRLLKDRKLSLVVDLDQTVIHAVCDQTVAEWKNDETNPNHAAVKDVESFELMDEGPNARPCSYFIKPRPGLNTFLKDMSEKYELHIYTMGTRTYAQNVAKIIDPDGKIFGNRILSRDESGSMTAKNLHRLFPVDTKMVVIIDDRGDIWGWSPNLIRVKAFNFYVGIGDINSSFLPKLNDTFATNVPADAQTSEGEIPALEDNQQPEENNSKRVDTTTSIEEQLVQMAGGSDASTIEQQWHEHSEEISSQMEDRPLLKKQEELDKQDEEEAKSSQASQTSQNKDASSTTMESTTTEPSPELAVQPPPAPMVHRHPLLKDDDDELVYLTSNLNYVHELFFHEYDQRKDFAQDSRIAKLKGEKQVRKRPIKDDLTIVPDVKDIMPGIKVDVLRNVVLCFTGVIPQGINHSFSDIGLWARSFGARVNPNLTKATTHVIADPGRRTFKVRQAAKHPNIKIVDKAWLGECFSKWQRVPETPFIIEVEDDNRPMEALPNDEFSLLDDGNLSDDNGSIVISNGDTAPSLGVLPSDVESELGRINGETTDDDTDGIEYDENGEAISPIDQLDGDDWDEIDKELQEFMGSDDDSEDLDSVEDDDDDEELDSDDSGTSKNSATSGSSKGSRKPRKRKRTESGNSSGAENESWGESDLQRRKKRAFERTTSLTKVQNAADVHTNGKKIPSNHDTDDELDKEMMRELMGEE